MQQAKITIEGVSRSREGVSRLASAGNGSFTEKNGYCYARYEETEESGMAGTTTTLKWNSSQVFLTRRGTYEMYQEFTEGNRCAGDYRTPYLMIPLETKTRKVRVSRLSYGWQILLEYELACAAADLNRITATIVVDLR